MVIMKHARLKRACWHGNVFEGFMIAKHSRVNARLGRVRKQVLAAARGASQAPLTLRPAYLAILCLGRAGAAGPSARASGAAGPGPGPSAPGPRGPLGCPLGALGVPGGTCQDLWTSLRDSPEQPQKVGGLKQSSWNDR